MPGQILTGDVCEQLRTVPERSVHSVVTSPPYWALRDYGVSGQIGLESTPEEYVAKMVEVFREVWRVLREDGTCWVNLGDSYASGGRSSYDTTSSNRGNGAASGMQRPSSNLKPKDIVGIPWRVAFALQADGWFLRQDIIWQKPAPMPESVRDRCTKSHEYIFLLTKSERYFFDAIAIQEKAVGVPGGNTQPNASYRHDPVKHRTKAGLADYQQRQREAGGIEFRNARSVWRISSRGFKGAHFATFPPELPERCIKAGTSERGCCPTCGAPWKRIVEKQRVPTRSGNTSKVYVDPENSPYEQHSGTIVENRDPLRHVTRTVTTDWQPNCKCPAHEPIPCTVLDPFLGSGTTALMAEHLGRNWLGCELNPEYAEMARQRIAAGYTPRKASGPPRRKRHRRERTLF